MNQCLLNCTCTLDKDSWHQENSTIHAHVLLPLLELWEQASPLNHLQLARELSLVD